MNTPLLLCVAVLTVVPPIDALAVDRSTTERRHFANAQPCPANGQKVYFGCTGYRIDHKVPLCSGGADKAGNMQWLAVAMKRSKDRIEHAACECVRKHGAKACPTVVWP